ncbi:hypothetical protein FGIG_00114 [Fasciola gigantica]|uniref:EGF-like domain-containing protein n=1 Tax=Fasciola gigantica TaxID=46835 RepID=A0A504YKJ0_FASGI|nr:hypothetical protein FGIG_00114 [Fasciola gigantica]
MKKTQMRFQHLVLLSTIVLAHGKLIPSKAVSLFPVLYDLSQRALVHVYSTRPINVTYRLFIQYSGQVEYTHPNSYYSKSISTDLHRVEFWFEYPFTRNVQFSKVELLIDFCGRLSTGIVECMEESTVHLFHELFSTYSDPLILIETDKETYHPGERIHIRCSLIRAEWWTIDGVSNRTKLQPNTELLKEPLLFDSIIILSGKDEVVQSWANVQLDHARNLTFRFPEKLIDFGEWKITASMAPNIRESMNVMVIPDVTPDLSIQFSEPQWFLQQTTYGWGKPPHVIIAVCANDSAGHVAQGSVFFLLCDCKLSSHHFHFQKNKRILNSRLIQSLFLYHACPDKSNTPIADKPCTFLESAFDSRGCQSFAVPVRELGIQAFQFGNGLHSLISCVRLWDSGLNRWYEHCTPVNTDAKMSSYSGGYELGAHFYKYGLPTMIDIHARDITQIGTPIDMILEQQLNYCPLTANQSLNPTRRNTLRYSLQFDKHGQSQLHMWPLYTFDDLTITASRGTWGDRWAVLRAYFTPSKAMIQPWPNQNPVHVNCNETVRLVIMGNQPLANKQFFVYGSMRGTLLPIQLREYTSDDSHMDSLNPARDDWLGHYLKGTDDGESRNEDENLFSCLPGWQGEGCLKPICAEGCDPVGGYCMFPGGCECQNGWIGALCDQCVFCPFDGNCATGSECSCPWYRTNRECTAYNSTLPPISLMTSMPQQTYTAQKGAKILHKRTLQLILNRSLDKPMPVSILYLEPMPNGTLDVISTQITLLPGRSCPSSGTVRFNMSRTWVGDSVELNVVVPVEAKSMNGTVCHVTVRNVRSLGISPCRTIVDSFKLIDDRFNHLFRSSPISRFRYSSVRDFWVAGISEGLDANETEIEGNRQCGFHLPPSPYEFQSTSNEPGELRTILFTSFQPNEILDSFNQTGARWILTVPPGETGWKASAFCYGPQFGMWMGRSDLLIVSKPIELDFTASRSARPHEKVSIYTRVHVTPTVQPYCVYLSVHLSVQQQSAGWRLLSPTTFSRCICEPPFETEWISFAEPGILATDGLFKVTLHIVPNAPQCSLPIEDMLITTDQPLSAKSQTRDLIKETRFARTRINQIDVDRWQTTVFRCSLAISKNLNETGLEQIDFHVPELGTDLDWSPDQYLIISPNLMGLFFRLFERSQNKPLLSGYDHLAMIVSGINVLNYLTEEPQQNQILSGTLRSNAFHIVVTSVHALNDLNCTDGMFGPFGGNCTPDDPWFESLLYRAVADVLRCKDRWIKDYLKTYVNSIVWHVENRWTRIQNEDGCFSPPPDTATEMWHYVKLALTAHRWISLYEHSIIDSYWPQRINIEPLLKKAKQCLLDTTANDLNNPDLMAEYPSTVLTLIARVFTTSDRHSSVSVSLIKWIRRIQVREHESVQNETLIHWGTSEEDEMEATTNAYWVLRQARLNSVAFLPVIRWALTKQDVNGDFPRSRDLYFASSLITNYSDWVRSEQLDGGLSIRIQVQPEGHPVHRLHIFKGNILAKFVRLPRTQRVKVTVTVMHGSLCSVFKLARFSLSKRTQSLSDSKLATVQRTNQSDCNHVTVSICLEPIMFRRIAALYVQAQSGWDMDSETRDLITSYNKPFQMIRRAQFDEMNNMHVLLETRVEYNKAACFNVNYTQTGLVLNSRPLLVSAIGAEFVHGEYLYYIRLPQCTTNFQLTNNSIDVKSETEKSFRLTKCPTVLQPCPETKQDILTGLEQLCDKNISLIYLNQKDTGTEEFLTSWLYRISNATKIEKWSTRLPRRLEICPLFNQTNVFVVLPDSRSDRLQFSWPRVRTSPPVRLVQMTRSNQGTNEFLRTVISPCLSLQTMIRLVYGILI